MSDKKAELIASLAKHCEDLVREAKDSIFHDGIMHKTNLNYAINPTISGLLFAALMRHIGYGPEREMTPEDDEITQFYIDMNVWFVEWSAYPSINTEMYGTTAVWDAVRLQRINKSGFLFIDIPFAILWIQKELTGELTIVDDKPSVKLGEEIALAVYQKLNEIFLPEYEVAVAAKEARLATPAKNVAQEPETEQPDRVAQLLVEPKKEVVAEAPKDEFDISALGNLDLDGAASRVEEMRQGGGEVVEASNECEGGACKI